MFIAHHHQLFTVLFVFAGVYARTQWTSPCPDLFQYEPLNPEEPGRWYGTVTIRSDVELTGVWLRVILDKPSLQLGNWFGEVETEDRKEYLVENPTHKVRVHEPLEVRFYIKYDPREEPPKLQGFHFNAKTVCPVDYEDTTPFHNKTFISETVHVGSEPGVDDDDFLYDGFIQEPPLKSKVTLDDLVCGTVVPSPRPLITEGQTAREAEFPWHVGLYQIKPSELQYTCGASLITRNHLITVAHCVTERKTMLPLRPETFFAYLGKHYLAIGKDYNSRIQQRNVRQITVHPEFNESTYDNNVAIVKLTSAVEITTYVRPVCLWNGDRRLEAIINKVGTVAGWGYDEGGKQTEQLTKAEMPVVSQQTCNRSQPDFFSKFTSNRTFCAGFNNGTSVCNGDSGGGLVFPSAATSQGRTVWQLRGLVSVSMAKKNQISCDTSHYVVFTDIAQHLDWIKNNID